MHTRGHDFAWYRARLGLPDGQPGAITVIQRFSSSLAVDPHFHSIVLDGLFVRDEATGARRYQAIAGRRRELPPLCAICEGYNLHVGVRLGAEARPALERLCKYTLRGPLPKTAYRNTLVAVGTTLAILSSPDRRPPGLAPARSRAYAPLGGWSAPPSAPA
ncbi:MAG: transposase, partial [Pseudomonadota bacterium]